MNARSRVYRILLGEDDPEQMNLYRLVIERRKDLELVAAVVDGAAAVEAFRAMQPPPDLVILDARMPTMTGVEATRAIHEIAPDARILVISAEKMIHDDALAAGATVFLPKPFDIRSFVKIVRMLCRGAIE